MGTEQYDRFKELDDILKETNKVCIRYGGNDLCVVWELRDMLKDEVPAFVIPRSQTQKETIFELIDIPEGSNVEYAYIRKSPFSGYLLFVGTENGEHTGASLTLRGVRYLFGRNYYVGAKWKEKEIEL